MRQYGKRSFITTASSERVQFQMVKAGVDQEPPRDGAHHLTIAEAEEGFLRIQKEFYLERAVSVAG